MKDAIELIQSSKSIIVSGHLRADGDCLGTESVVYHLCKALGKKVRIINPDQPDSRYSNLYEHTPYEVWTDGAELPEHDLFIVCDCAVPERLGELALEVEKGSAKRLVIDHHPMTADDARYWDVLMHDHTAAASGILAMRLVDGLNVDLPIAALEACFVAIAADTGWFKYSNANTEAWQCAARLVAAGVIPDVLFRTNYQQAEQTHARGVSVALKEVRSFAGGRAMLSNMTQADLLAANASLDDSDDVLDLMRATGKVEVVAFVYEREDGVVKASLRSKEFVDVCAIAKVVGGGGHERASGMTFEPSVSIEDAVTVLEELIGKALA